MKDLVDILKEAGWGVDVYDPAKETTDEWLKRVEKEARAQKQEPSNA